VRERPYGCIDLSKVDLFGQITCAIGTDSDLNQWSLMSDQIEKVGNHNGRHEIADRNSETSRGLAWFELWGSYGCLERLPRLPNKRSHRKRSCGWLHPARSADEKLVAKYFSQAGKRMTNCRLAQTNSLTGPEHAALLHHRIEDT
jgi:hypothetical protein